MESERRRRVRRGICGKLRRVQNDRRLDRRHAGRADRRRNIRIFYVGIYLPFLSEKNKGGVFRRHQSSGGHSLRRLRFFRHDGAFAASRKSVSERQRQRDFVRFHRFGTDDFAYSGRRARRRRNDGGRDDRGQRRQLPVGTVYEFPHAHGKHRSGNGVRKRTAPRRTGRNGRGSAHLYSDHQRAFRVGQREKEG